MYSNAAFIADLVLPRVPVGKQSFRYGVYDQREHMTIQDTRVGRKSAPNKVAFSKSESDATCLAYGLDDDIPLEDVENSPEGYDPVGNSVEKLSELVLLHREQRVANLVFAAATYATGLKVQLSGNHQWNVKNNDADPIEDIEAGESAMLRRYNTMVFGRGAWAAFRRNPFILKAVNRTSGDAGRASREDVADLFEIEPSRILVGEAWYNTAKRGQAASRARLWGNHVSLLYIDPVVRTTDTETFGITGQWGERLAGADPDKSIGPKGGQKVRVVEYVKELVTAQHLGYFIQDASA
jgi:hypothetical protein